MYNIKSWTRIAFYYFSFFELFSVSFLSIKQRSEPYFFIVYDSVKKKKKRNIQGNGKLPNHLITSSTSSLLKNANGLNFVSKKTFAAKLIGGSFSDYIKKPIYLRWNHFLNNKRRPLFLVGSVQINFTTFKSDAVHVIFLCFES